MAIELPGKELEKKVADLFGSLLGPMAEELGLTIGQEFALYRLKRLKALGEKAKKMLDGRPIPKDPNLGRILPILQAGSLESDDDLHSRWAALLANAIENASNVPPSYIEVLKQLTSSDAKAVDILVQTRIQDALLTLEPLGTLLSGCVDGSADVESQISQKNEIVENLERLGILRRFDLADSDVIMAHSNEFESTDHYEVTIFATKFVRACTAPAKPATSTE